MERTGIRAEERTGLIVAVALHLALLAALVIRAMLPQPVFEKPARMTVSLTEDVGLEDTAPEPVPESRAAVAPTMSDIPAPSPQVEQPIPREVAPPVPRVQSTIPAPRAQPRETRRPDAPRTQAQPRNRERSGGSRLGDNFLEGAGSSTSTNETRVPASRIGASAKASLVQAIARRIKPRWEPPSGPEVEKITTYLRFRLNPDGSLAGRPEMIRQTGVNDTNRAQANRHAEQAIRAVQLAAPFDDLPPEYYEAWKLVGPFGFDWRLSQ
ncbi:energy transducer TonB [Qipengyuania sp. 6B39]|uniref:energy transducer TonB n=1 Tax=Qipengyuania proteolytica TaxID=2867239 RepID=UPI001C8991A2|nr:energy transducer TonB [Qipengyuania proteolytica]MBX7495075.1 energy transducer TonB [Qipengyuania proteolytica]